MIWQNPYFSMIWQNPYFSMIWQNPYFSMIWQNPYFSMIWQNISPCEKYNHRPIPSPPSHFLKMHFIAALRASDQIANKAACFGKFDNAR
jgi:hypothetical protein